ncbi:MAG: asparaginase [Candidatus Eisenbacteria bacterium]
MRFHLEVLVRRGDVLESRHRVQCAVSDPRGRLEAATETPEVLTTFRSAAKPFQLLPLVERGHALARGYSDEQLAVMTASHSGSRYHLGLVRDILDGLGLGPDHLACAYHHPADPESLADVWAYPASRSGLYNNCSGKHAGMLALALAEGWPTKGYEQPEHPLQRLMRVTVAQCCGVSPESMPVAVDGCGVCVFALPLAAMARGYATLALATAQGGTDGRSQGMQRIGRAMGAYPITVEGRDSFSTALMSATAGRLLAKGGAEGLQLVGSLDRSFGLALKCEDGAMRAVAPATMAVLEMLGALRDDEKIALAAHRHPVVLNAAGLEVGILEADLRVGAHA